MNIVHSFPLLLLVSCASYPPPSDHLASAIAEARAAREIGAGNLPRAALQLKLAEEQIAQAQEMMKNGDNERADYMTLRAYNDAELALAMARESAIRARAEQLQASLGSSPGPQQNPPH
ncbi:MAG TPA: DUF4398 domain-containing protein [Polyangiaceae bacterium]|nr:DUF4398 domain-containing protein [Polyangiaceae bacterium]